MKKILFLLALIIMAGICEAKGSQDAANGATGNTENPGTGDKPIILGQDDFYAYFAEIPPVIDGVGDDPCWAKAQWQDIKYAWMYQSRRNNR